MAEEDGMQVFVTGATGVLGRRVLPLLVDAGHQVTAVSRSKPDQIRAAGAAPVAVELFDAGALRRAVAGHDAVLDLATRIPSTARMALPWAWWENDRLRSEAAANAAEAAVAAGARYVRESIGFLYADAGDRWIDEQAPVEPVGYNETALDAESAAQRVTDAGGVGVALRFAEFYGPDSMHTRDRMRLARKGVGAVLGERDAFWSRIHLDDAATAVVSALDVPAGIYNVVDDEPLRRHEHIGLLGELVGRELWPPPAFIGKVGPASAVARSVRMDNAKLRAVSDWAPTYPSVREGYPPVVAALLS